MIDIRCFLDAVIGKAGYKEIGRENFVSSRYRHDTLTRRLLGLLKEKSTHEQAHRRPACQVARSLLRKRQDFDYEVWAVIESFWLSIILVPMDLEVCNLTMI
jgi:hypothetical protein